MARERRRRGEEGVVAAPPLQNNLLACGSHCLAIVASCLSCPQTGNLAQVSRACRQVTLLPGAWHTLEGLPPLDLLLTHPSLRHASSLLLHSRQVFLLEESLALLGSLDALTLRSPQRLNTEEVKATLRVVAKLPRTLTSLGLPGGLLRSGLRFAQARALSFPGALREVTLAVDCVLLADEKDAPNSQPSGTCCASVLGRSLGELRALRAADLRLRRISRQGARDLLRGLAGLPALHKLSLLFLMENEVPASASWLTSLVFCQGLLSLTLAGLSHFLRSQADCDTFADVVAGLTGLRALQLDARAARGQAAHGGVGESLGRALGRNRKATPRLRLLDLRLSGTPLGDDGLEALSGGLAGQAALQALTLDLRDTGCTCRGCEHLGPALAGRLRNEGLELLVLRLEDNAIRSRGTRGLASGLSRLRDLRHLELRLDGVRSCSLAEDVGAALGALHGGLDTLTLSLQRTGLLDAGMAPLAEGLLPHKAKLVYLLLALEDNLMQGPGLQKLADALLAVAPKLPSSRTVKVTWADNDVPPEVSAHLAGVFDTLNAQSS